MILNSKKNNTDVVLFKFLRLTNFDVTLNAVSDELNRHPDYPHLLALNDVSRHFGAAISAYQISKDDISKIPCPFIAHTNQHGSEFILVKKINSPKVVYADQISDNNQITIEKFVDWFSGVALVADDDPNLIGQKRDTSTFQFERYRNKTGLILLAFGVLTGILVLGYSDAMRQWQTILLTVFKTAGLITSVLLLIQSIDRNNPLIQTLCGGNGKTNCNAILSSKAANVFNGLSWSEVGFFYFAGTWLLLLFSNNAPLALKTIAVLNLLSLPYTVYSIYHQARIAKQWCVLCCTVQALLWLEFVPNASLLALPLPLFNLQDFAVVCFNLTLPLALWLLTKPQLLKLQQVQPLKDQLRKFKYNTDVFGKLLAEQPRFAAPAEQWSIVLGNAEASNMIVMVSNPYCQPCATAHETIHNWLQTNRNIQLRVVFTADNSDTDIRTPISRHLLEISATGDKVLLADAMHSWYSQKSWNYNHWSKAYPQKFNDNTVQKIEKHKEWCKLADVEFTPTLYVNGYRLPDPYRIDDIEYFLQ